MHRHQPAKANPAREVGTEGKSGGQADVHGVAGTWKDLTDNVNLMASNLTSQVRNITAVTTAVANGDLAKKITVDVKGEFLELKDTINTMVDQLRSFASEVTRVAREVGTEGRLGGQAKVEGVSGTWKDLTDGVNSMASNLTSQMRNIAEVTTAVANGDLSKKITVDVQGEILELKSTINTMVDQLNSFASEVTRVAREVGTDGKLGGQANVQGVAGIEMLSDLPVALQTDGQRLEQVLKNLLSNAFKFTERGGIVLRIGASSSGWSPNHPTLGRQSGVVAFSVTDTGIGIPPEKHAIVFEAFQQADGSTSRRYGGTGLGLAISREIARLLGGEIALSSAVGRGSTFTLYLPLEIPGTSSPSAAATKDAVPSSPSNVLRPYTPSIVATEEVPMSGAVVTTAADDRYDIRPGDRILLVAEDNPNFGSYICEVARGHGVKCLLAQDGFSPLTLIREFQPDAITLDIGLPHLDGWRLLDRLKSDLGTRHIPVAAISASDECQRALKMGCIRFCTKPVAREQVEEVVVALQRFVEQPLRRVLILEDDPAQQLSIAELIKTPKVEITTASDADSALTLMEEHEFDCLVLDLRLPGRISGNQLLEEMQRQPRYRNLATVVYTGKVLSAEEEIRLNQLARSIVLKDVRSPERLLDQATLRLHNHVADLSGHQLALLKSLHSDRTLLTGRNVLLVDDDIRNVFAMTSVLERYGMAVVAAESGPEALAKLEANTEIDIALMDIMLPEMDGYKVTQAIRAQTRFKSLPIVALTAKAMKGDREKCIEAGCSDYLAKPVDIEQLLSVLRLWLHR